jgi:methylthioribose-1-phosphate isomerase
MERSDSAAASQAIWWDGDAVGYVDQRALPHELRRARAGTVGEVVEAISTLAVRGAPCIGIFGAYGVVLARTLNASDEAFHAAAERIRRARPTAVNLAWAVDRVLGASSHTYLDEARAIHEEQIAVDRAIGLAGAELIRDGAAVLTHCNTGPLATGGDGTALGIIIAAHRAGKRVRAYVDETRPLLQGARLTTYELAAAGVPATLIADSAAAATMREKKIAAVIVGADRIATNGDTANKIGTYSLAIVAAHHGIPFFVAAPRSTIDFSLSRGDEIAIEQRSADEVRSFGTARTAPAEVDAYNPAFDVTPGRLITAIVTEYGVSRPPYEESIAGLADRPRFAALAALARER